MADQGEPSTLLLLGEIRGQLRELIHNSNSNSTKLDALGIRVAALEAERNRQEGRDGVFHTILRSPAIGWIVAAAGAVWAFLSGKLNV